MPDLKLTDVDIEGLNKALAQLPSFVHDHRNKLASSCGRPIAHGAWALVQQLAVAAAANIAQTVAQAMEHSILAHATHAQELAAGFAALDAALAGNAPGAAGDLIIGLALAEGIAGRAGSCSVPEQESAYLADTSTALLEAKVFPGYDYTHREPLGAATSAGSPEQIMSIFRQKVHEVFPFQIDPPGPIHDGDILTLHPAPGWVGGSGVVKVHTTPTSVTFTVLNGQYFDPPGSQITFSAVEENGQVYLQQHGYTPSTAAGGFFGDHGGMINITWDQQASNLRDVLQVPQSFNRSSPFDYYNWVQHHDGGDVHVPYVPTPIPLPIPDKLTPDIRIGGVHIPSLNPPNIDITIE